MVYADVDGHIGYQAAGKVPVRSPRPPGRLPRSRAGTAATTGPGRPSRSRACRRCWTPTEGFIVIGQPGRRPGRATATTSTAASTTASAAQRIRDELEQRGVLSRRRHGRAAARHRATRSPPTLVPYLLDVDAGGPYYAGGQELLRGVGLRPRRRLGGGGVLQRGVGAAAGVTFTDQLPATVAVQGGDRWFEVVRKHPRRPHRRVVGRRGHRGARGPRRHRCAGRCGRPATTWSGSSHDARRVDLGSPAHAEPGEPDRRAESDIALGGGAVQPRARGSCRRRPARRQRDRLDRRRGLSRSTGCRRCGWWCRSPTSTTPPG